MNLRLLLLLSLISCRQLGAEHQNTNSKSIASAKSAASNTIVKRELFIFKNDSIEQKLILSKSDSNSVRFSITTNNFIRKKVSQIDGIATKRDSQDGSESDEDDEGNSYLVQEFFYDKGCWIALRIEDDDHLFARIVEANCSHHRNDFCPFESIGLLKKVRE